MRHLDYEPTRWTLSGFWKSPNLMGTALELERGAAVPGQRGQPAAPGSHSPGSCPQQAPRGGILLLRVRAERNAKHQACVKVEAHRQAPLRVVLGAARYMLARYVNQQADVVAGKLERHFAKAWLVASVWPVFA